MSGSQSTPVAFYGNIGGLPPVPRLFFPDELRPYRPPVRHGPPGFIPWAQWLTSMTVAPYVNDPPPTPVVVSYYYGHPFHRWPMWRLGTWMH